MSGGGARQCVRLRMPRRPFSDLREAVERRSAATRCVCATSTCADLRYPLAMSHTIAILGRLPPIISAVKTRPRTRQAVRCGRHDRRHGLPRPPTKSIECVKPAPFVTVPRMDDAIGAGSNAPCAPADALPVDRADVCTTTLRGRSTRASGGVRGSWPHRDRRACRVSE